MTRIQVGLGERSYPLIIEKGLLAAIGADLQRRGIAKRFGVIADAYVASLFGKDVMASLAGAGIAAELMTFPRGEENKNLATMTDLASKLAQLHFDRKDGLIALGGGVTGDITGFLAGIYMRGIPFVQIPTTLLAQVDSSVGGKTGVDIPEGKNLVGVFYQPQVVYIDTGVLSLLPRSELLNGLAEVIKYSIIYDREFFDFLAVNREAILALDPAMITSVISRCCSIKAEVVAADEREANLRRILNYGHTIGHAVEGASRYTLDHGVAVGMGMVAAADIAVMKGMLAADEAAAIKELIQAYGLPAAIPAEMSRTTIKAYLKTDKKSVGGRPFFVLPTTIGAVEITDDVPEEMLDQVLLNS